MRLLIVEDSPELHQQLRVGLTEAGFAVDGAMDGEEAYHLGETEPYDAVVLDLGLPRVDGLTVLRRWRAAERAMPVLILTARDSWTEKVEGLNAGADDYLAKPFDPRELALRIRTILRRATPRPAPTALPEGPMQLGQRWFDAERCELRGPEGTQRLTGGEAALLTALARRAGEVLSREEIAVALGTPDAGERSVDVQVTRLRRKIETDPREPRFLHTIRHKGYVLRPGP